MTRLNIGLILILLGGILWMLGKREKTGERVMRVLAFKIGGIVCCTVSLFLFASTSFIIIDAEEVGHLNRIYLAKPMKPGQIIALKGQKGPQAQILPPGFHLSPFIRVLNKIEFKPLVEVKAGSYGKVGVVKSNVQQVEEEPGAIERVTTGLNLVAQVVPRGYRGGVEKGSQYLGAGSNRRVRRCCGYSWSK